MNSIMEKVKQIIENITKRPCRITSTGELECVCPKCFGSKTRKNKRQFYVSLKETGNPFICFRCGFKGKLSNLIEFFLKEYNIRIPYEPISFSEEKIEEEKDLRFFYILNHFRKKQLHIYEETQSLENVFCDNCRPYLLERIFGKNKDFGETILRQKNLLDNFNKNLVSSFLCCKIVEKLTKNKYKNTIGITSASGNVLQLRNINDKTFRYISLKSLPFDWESYFIFTLGNFLEPKYIILAEGVFTLIRGFLFLLGKNYFTENDFVLVSTFGKQSLFKSLKDFEKKHFAKTIVLLDQDVDLKYPHIYKAKFLKPIKNYKDFGEIELTDRKTVFLEVKHEFKNAFSRTYGREF